MFQSSKQLRKITFRVTAFSPLPPPPSSPLSPPSLYMHIYRIYSLSVKQQHHQLLGQNAQAKAPPAPAANPAVGIRQVPDGCGRPIAGHQTGPLSRVDGGSAQLPVSKAVQDYSRWKQAQLSLSLYIYIYTYLLLLPKWLLSMIPPR